MNNNNPPELIRAALAYIPANCTRDEWARVAMAIKSEYPDDTGRDLFTDWSAIADNFDSKATAGTWRSVKGAGGVGIGSLLHLAKERGFDVAKWHRENNPDTVQTPEQKREADAQRERDRAANRERENAERAAAHDRAASDAATLWNEASEAGQSAYLERKGVQAHGVRFTPDGWALVPVRDAVGKLWNLQRIAPEKPTDGGPDKLFLKGGRKSGLWHLIGDLGSDPARPDVVLVAEGYATAASIHEATGRPVAVAFDAGNLAPVAKVLHSLWPRALLVIAGDDDTQTHARTGNNPGREKATAASRSAQGLAVFPVPLPEGGSDFNDLHAASGLDAVRACIEKAIEAHQAHQAAAQSTKASKRGKGRQSARRDASGANGDDRHDTHDTGRAFDRFHVDDEGVRFTPPGDDGGMPRRICGRLVVIGRAYDGHLKDAALLLEFDTEVKNGCRWLMPLSMLSGDGLALRSELLYQGFMTPPDAKRKALLLEYLQSRQHGKILLHVHKIGWCKGSYVLPEETIGSGADSIIFHTEGATENAFRTRKTADEWRDRVSCLCVGNSRLSFAVVCAFAGPLLTPAGMSSSGFHFKGDSSTGKSTAQYLASSVYGGRDFKQTWRATGNGLEGVAAQHNDCTLILDEIGQASSAEIGDVVYMLGNGEGKTRSTRGGQTRPRLRWNLIFLSSGEKTLAQMMLEAGKTINAGQEVRMIEVPADAGAGMGMLESLHGVEGPDLFAKRIDRLTATIYGAVGLAWLQYLTANPDKLKGGLRGAVEALKGALIPTGSDSQVSRVAAYFALVGVAGEMATEAGLTGWPVGESERAATTCFNAWLATRSGTGNSEGTAMLRQVRAHLDANGNARYADWDNVGNTRAPKTINHAGFRRLMCASGEWFKDTTSLHSSEETASFRRALDDGAEWHYFVFTDVFRNEICKGFNFKRCAQLLIEKGCLIPTGGVQFASKARLPGKGKNPVYCYQINSEIFKIEL